MVEDCKNSPSGTYFLMKYCGINLYNEDTGAISGYDAGNSTIKTTESVVPESGEAEYPSENSFTKRGLTVIVPDKSTLTESEQIIVKGLYSWWIEESLKLIEESYGSNYSFVNNPYTITVKFNNGDYWASTNGSTLYINTNFWKNIMNGDENGYMYTSTGAKNTAAILDQTIAHELTHVIMSSNINPFWDLPS